jgi:hypothetical protein
MTNVMLDEGKEIDLLGVNPRTNEKYHVEVRVSIAKAFRIRLIDTQTKDGRKHKRGLDTLNEIKYQPVTVVNAINEIFGTTEYNKVLVVWDVESEELLEESKNRYSIAIWKMGDILDELTKGVKTRAYRDDVLRTVQLICQAKKT